MASTSIYRTQSTATNRKIFTLSMWVKMSKTGSDQSAYQFCDFYVSSSISISIYHDDQDHLNCYMIGGGYDNNIFVTNAKLRDKTAWYHLVWRFDTTQATASDRVRLYINGELATFSSYNAPSQDFNLQQGTSSYTQYYGRYGGHTNNNFDGIMSHIHFCDGYSYGPDSFGSTDSTTGQWEIITNPSVSYGNNGHFILKDGNSVTDQSGNSLSFSTGGTLTKTEDCPSNNFCTLSGLYNIDGSYSLENGNTKFVPTGNNDGTFGTLAGIGGKFYYEVKFAAGSDTIYAGYSPVQLANNEGNTNPITSFIGQYRNTGLLQIGGSTDTAYTSVSDGDIFAFAIDLEASSGSRTVKAYKNGSLYGTVTIGTSYENDMWLPVAGDTSGGNSGRLEFNFGNGYFGSTAVSSAGTNASNIGIFEYDVPSGYTALSTKGLNL